MNFDEILRGLENKDELILGHENNKLFINNIKENPSIIITGSTGTGKSVMLDQILIELITTHTSLEMGLVLIDTSGVELNYYTETNYSLLSAINDIDKSIVVLSRVLKEIDRRKELLKGINVSTFDEYNEKSLSKLPLLVIAIDDDKLLLRNQDVEKMLKSIIDEIKDLGMLFILSTSDIYNKFFKKDMNELASTLISFDYQSEEDSEKANIEGINNLGIGRFIAKQNNESFEYSNFEFNEELLKKVIELLK